MRSVHSIPRKTLGLLELAEKQARERDVQAIALHEQAFTRRSVDLARHGSFVLPCGQGESTWKPPVSPRDPLLSAAVPVIVEQHADPERPWKKITVYGAPAVTRDRDLARKGGKAFDSAVREKPIGAGNAAKNKYAADVLLALLASGQPVELTPTSEANTTIETATRPANHALDTGLYLTDQTYLGGEVLGPDGQPETVVAREQRKARERARRSALASCESRADALRAAFAAATYGQHVPLAATKR